MGNQVTMEAEDSTKPKRYQRLSKEESSTGSHNHISEPFPDERHHRNRCCRCLRFFGYTLFAIFILFMLIAFSYTTYAVFFRPRHPIVIVDWALVSSFNPNTSTHIVTGNVELGIRVRNPNKKFCMEFHTDENKFGLKAALLYSDHVLSLSKFKVEKLEPKTEKSTPMTFNFVRNVSSQINITAADYEPLTNVGIEKMADDRKNGSLNLTITMEGRIRIFHKDKDKEETVVHPIFLVYCSDILINWKYGEVGTFSNTYQLSCVTQFQSQYKIPTGY